MSVARWCVALRKYIASLSHTLDLGYGAIHRSRLRNRTGSVEEAVSR